MYLKYLKYTLKSIWYNNWKARLPIYLKKYIYFYEILSYAKSSHLGFLEELEMRKKKEK